MLIAQITTTTATPRTIQPVVDMKRLQGGRRLVERNKSTLDGIGAANGNRVGVAGGSPVVASKLLKAHAIGAGE